MPTITSENIKYYLDQINHNKINSIFPETGDFRRELYPKHTQFFANGLNYRERIFIAANRCLTPWTYLSKNRLILSALCEKNFDVQAWGGESQYSTQASGGFLKNIDQAFRVVVEDGQFFDCTDEHRLLTTDGYVSLNNLLSRSSGLRLIQKIEDYQSNCVADGYLCDQQLHLVINNGVKLIPKLDDAQRRSRLIWRKDEVEHIDQYSHVLRDGAPLSSLDDLKKHEALFSQFSIGAYDKSVLQLSYRMKEFHQFLHELNQISPDQPLVDSQSYVSRVYASCLAVENKLGLLDEIFPELRQLLSVVCLKQITARSLISNSHISIFYPLNHLKLIGNKRIKAVVPIGLQPIVDFTVPICNNYFLAGIYHHNTGKTISGGYEMTCHLTGIYPDWWEGKRFNKPITAWCAGDTSKTTRDILQNKLLGPAGQLGTGLIPKEKIGRELKKAGVPDAIEIVYVMHVSGKESVCMFKSYDQRRESFQGTECDVIWLDEEPPMNIYVECLLRTMTTNGMVFITFTPLYGLSEVVLSFCPSSEVLEGCVKDSTTKAVTTCDWDSVPHLNEKDKGELLASIPPFQRDARSKGIPQLGSGAIYPVPESDIIVDDFEIPKHYRLVFGMDVGWSRTAVVWGAYDDTSDVVYIYSEHYRGEAEPVVHSQAIKARGEWIPGVIDPAARGRGQSDGHVLIDMYQDLGLKLQQADNSVETGLYKIWERLSSGRLKFFKSLGSLRSEYRVYRRDEKGRIVKSNDHLMDALRYLIMSGLDIAKKKEVSEIRAKMLSPNDVATGWMR